jgi:UDP-N-acetylglucosamine acyltransferase
MAAVAVHQFTRIGCAMVGGFSGIVQKIPYMIAAGAREAVRPNTIGSQRHGLSDTTINAIKNAYKILFREKGL